MESKIIFHTGIEQKSEAWFNLRLGKFTGSEIWKLMGARGLGKQGNTYIHDKFSEILTGKVYNIPDNKYFEHGRYYEPIAKKSYEEAANILFEDIGFIEHPDFENCGASPDGINFEIKTGIEIKCPETQSMHSKHILIENQNDLKKLKPDNYWQIMFLMLICGFEKWKFISYHPDFTKKKDLRLFAIDVFYNQTDINILADRIGEANFLLNKKLNKVL